MIVCGIDLETSGTQIETDHITEIAWEIKDTSDPKPLRTVSHFVRHPETLVLSEENIALTKITHRHLRFGTPFLKITQELMHDLKLFGVEAMLAHNGTDFDRPFLWSYIKRTEVDRVEDTGPLAALTWIDTLTDLPYPDGCKQRSLLYVSAYYNFLNPFPHAALSDVQTTLKIFEHFDPDAALARAKSPSLVARAHVGFELKELAKERKFQWERLGDKVYPKAWVKRIKEMDLEAMRAEAPFHISVLS